MANVVAATAVVEARPRGAVSVARDLVALTKPRITLVVLLTALAGIKLAHGALGRSQWVFTLVGTALLVGSANAFNMWMERDVDARMARTKSRPLPAGRLAPATAFWFAATLGVVSLPMLWFGVNAATTLLGAIALGSYVLVYTPMKRRSMRALWVGAIPGAIPPLLGYAAVTGRIDAAGLSLFAALFVWQIPHFLAISIFRVDDYANAGLVVAPRVLGDAGTDWMIVRYSVILVAASLWPWREGLGGTPYLVAAVVLGAAWMVVAIRGFGARDRVRAARGLFGFSILYLVALFGTLVISG